MVTQQRESTAVEPSIETFASFHLNTASMMALANQDITIPTPIQSAAIPPLLQGRDLIGQARTGSGKTLAFVLPAIDLIDITERAVQVMVLTPTRELAVQIGDVVDQIGGEQGIKPVLVVGGRSPGPQISAIRRGAQVVIGTPGRVLDLIRQRALRLDNLRFLVLDEADGLLDRGFGPDVERIIGHTPRGRQMALFSATVPEWVQEIAANHLYNPEVVALDTRPEDNPPIDHQAFLLPNGDKVRALREILDHKRDGSIIVFGRTKHGVRKLAKRLEKDGYPVAALQGNLSQNARERVMREFRSEAVQILIATNVAARGLDISTVDLVVNIDLPESSELLTHRIGRTGRMGRQGQAITLLGPDDHRKWRSLGRDLGQQITPSRWPGAAEALNAESDDLVEAFEVKVRQQEPSQPKRSRAKQSSGTQASQSSNGKDRRQLRYGIVCDACGKQDTVPFRPDRTRKIYCRDCYNPPRRSRQSARA